MSEHMNDQKGSPVTTPLTPHLDPDPTRPPTPADDLVIDDAPPPGSGLEELGPADLRLPQLRLRQPRTLHADRVPEGSWFATDDPSVHSLGRDLVVLDVRKERSLLLPFGRGAAARAVAARIQEKTGVEVPADWEGPVCSSLDRVRPVVLDGLPPLAAACAACPMARWRTERGRRRQDCAESYRLVLLDLVTGRPCVFFARGAAIRPTRELLTALRTQCERHRRPAWAFSVFALSRRVEGPDGPYHVPVFGPPFAVEPSQLPFHRALRQRLSAAGDDAWEVA